MTSSWLRSIQHLQRLSGDWQLSMQFLPEYGGTLSHSVLELLRHRLLDSLDHMLAFVCINVHLQQVRSCLYCDGHTTAVGPLPNIKTVGREARSILPLQLQIFPHCFKKPSGP